MRGAGRARAAAALLAAWALAPAAARAQELRRPEEQLAAIHALKVQLEMEQIVLDRALQRHGDVSRARATAAARLARLYQELDDMVEGRAESEPLDVLEREEQVARIEQEIRTLSEDGRRAREQIRTSHERIDILQDRIARLRRTLPSDAESLTGNWEVSYLPSGDKGVFTLRQSGTLLVGEYVLEGGWKGSLQGTIVDGKILLHRIDSKLGRSSDLEGALAPDGRTIRGTWQSFILSGGQPTSGSWIAQKRRERSEP